MSSATVAKVVGRPHRLVAEQRLDLGSVTFEQYETIGDALPECRGVKMIYLDGSLTFVTTSRRHDWLAECLGDIVKAVANGLQMEWEIAGRATFRREDQAVGIEGDQTFYFGDHAVSMRGGVNIDLAIQPPPDLAIEVEVTHSAGKAMLTWGRIGVPEVWRFDAESSVLRYWIRRPDGHYDLSDRSVSLPILQAEEVVTQLRLAENLGSSAWNRQLNDWVREGILPRLGGVV